jgi:hypothetical protein
LQDPHPELKVMDPDPELKVIDPAPELDLNLTKIYQKNEQFDNYDIKNTFFLHFS